MQPDSPLAANAARVLLESGKLHARGRVEELDYFVDAALAMETLGQRQPGLTLQVGVFFVLVAGLLPCCCHVTAWAGFGCFWG